MADPTGAPQRTAKSRPHDSGSPSGAALRSGGAEARFRSLFDANVVGVIVADTSGLITDANDAFLRMVGYERSDLPLHWDEMTPPEWRDQDALKVQEAQQTGNLAPFEKEYLHKDGRRVPILVGGAYLHGSESEYVCVVLDLTERKRAKQSLRQSEAKHRALVENIPDAMFRIDRDGVYLDYVPADAFEQLAPPEKFLGKTVREVLPPPVAALCDSWVERALETGKLEQFEYSLEIGGEQRCFEARLVPDEPDSVMALIRDITQRRRAEAALKESEARYRALYENIPLMYFTLDADGTVLSVNAQGAEQLGYAREELEGRPVLGVFHADDRAAVRQQIAELVKGSGQVAHWEFRKVRKDGRVIWVRESASTATDPQGRTIVLVVCEDITERKRAERKAVAQRTELKRLSSAVVLAEERERQKLARELHDDVAQVLAIARGKLGTLDASSGERQSSHADVCDALDEAIRQMRSLTFELSSPILQQLGLGAALQSLGEAMAVEAGFAFHYRSDAPVNAVADDACIVLYRAARELMTNVVKYAAAKDVQVSLDAVDGELRLAIEDNGRGFDAHGLTEGFSTSGTFGLFSVGQQVEHIGGRFEITSQVGAGTRAVISVPLIEDAAGM